MAQNTRPESNTDPVAQKPPNILVVMSDQHRWDYMGCSGHSIVQTPTLDRLAGEGICYTSCYTNSPVCMPARSSFLSGLYCHNHGQWGNYGHLPDNADTFIRRLRDHGYRTAHIGRGHFYNAREMGVSHLDDARPFMRGLGFQDVLETSGSYYEQVPSMLTEIMEERGCLESFREDMDRRQESRKAGQEPLWPSNLSDPDNRDSIIAHLAGKYLSDYEHESPFCAFVGFFGPHDPWDPPSVWADRYKDVMPETPLARPELPEWLSESARDYCSSEKMMWGQPTKLKGDEWIALRRLYYGKVSHIDACIGRILEVLERRGMLEDTVVVYISDHGERLGDRGAIRKAVFHEEAVRVPLIIRGPGVSTGSNDTGLCETVDVMPTLLELAGLDASDCRGRSLAGESGRAHAEGARAVFSEYAGRVATWGKLTMIRTERHKMVVNQRTDVLQLFDLQEDPSEMLNLAGRADMADTEAMLKAEVLRWQLEDDEITAP